MQSELTWVGLEVDNFLIEELIGEGVYSWIYLGTSIANQESKVFKVAKPHDLIGITDNKKSNTEALFVYSGGIANVHPNTKQLLLQQAQKLDTCRSPQLVEVFDFVSEPDMAYYKMEYVQGKSVRELMILDALPISLLIEIAKGLSLLSEIPGFDYHGDIKPDNILVDSNKVRFIDPGYFGPIDCQEGEDLQCMVTTSTYYPLLKPDDLFAFGIMLWEIACKQHPLGQSSQENQTSKTGPKLEKLVASYENVGQYYLSPILNLTRPREIHPAISDELEKILLKAMRLDASSASGQLELADGYQSFEELARDLEKLTEQEL